MLLQSYFTNFFITNLHLPVKTHIKNNFQKKTQIIFEIPKKTLKLNINLKYQFWVNFLFENKKITSNKYLWLNNFSVYLGFFLKLYTGNLINWHFLNLRVTKKKSFLLKVWRETYKKFILKNFYCSSWFYFFLMIQLFFFKDIQHFVSFIKKIIQKYSLKHHRRLFRLVGTIFSNYLKLSHKTNELKGYRIYFKGKLGKKGSVKKSIIYLSDGQISFTNKNLRYNYKYFLIPTETGVVGCYLACFYT